MSYSLALIISSVFVVPFVLLGGDLVSLQAAYNQIDNIAITVGYLIAKNSRVDDEYISQLEENYKITFENITPKSPQPGETVEFTIYRMYSPLVISSNEIKVVAKRYTVIGYYGWKKGGKQ